ncbi:hypothetical protein AB0I37_26250 [Micromonospora purpureochromogenes]|uniref:hypothetical protein n=1 Tax=Micromonospora purpureochromogenes TaxID=47872 RepID=UPI0034068754
MLMHDLVEQLPPGFTDTFHSCFVEVNDVTLHTVIVGAVGPEPGAGATAPGSCRAPCVSGCAGSRTGEPIRA